MNHLALMPSLLQCFASIDTLSFAFHVVRIIRARILPMDD
jgi:hypothetical protein